MQGRFFAQKLGAGGSCLHCGMVNPPLSLRGPTKRSGLFFLQPLSREIEENDGGEYGEAASRPGPACLVIVVCVRVRQGILVILGAGQFRVVSREHYEVRRRVVGVAAGQSRRRGADDDVSRRLVFLVVRRQKVQLHLQRRQGTSDVTHNPVPSTVHTHTHAEGTGTTSPPRVWSGGR